VTNSNTNFISRFITRVKRREGCFFSFVYILASKGRSLTLPCWVLPAYTIIDTFFRGLGSFLRWSGVTFWYKPLFMSRCTSVGEGLRYVKLQQGLPYIAGNIRIILGKNITVHSRSSFSAASVYDEPQLIVGDNTYLGPGFSIGVGLKIMIGARCLIASNVNISDNDGHPLDPKERAMHRPLPKESFLPVQLGDDVWIGEGAVILKGVNIGNGAVVGAKSVVTGDVAPFTVVAGNPAKLIKNIS